MDHLRELRRVAGYVFPEHNLSQAFTNTNFLDTACDWWHGLPQLFWKVSHYNYSISSCAQIELIPETIDGED